MMRILAMGCVAAALGSLSACGGSAVDLDRGNAPSVSRAGDGGLESLWVGSDATALWADDSRIYWASADRTQGAQGCVFDDCAATATTYGKPVSTLVSTAQDVFFFSNFQDSSQNNFAMVLLRCAKQGCDGAPTEVVRDRANTPNGMLLDVDEEYLYWVSRYDVLRCPLSGCAEVPERVSALLPDDSGITDSSFGSSGLQLAGNAVYWASGATVYSAAKDGSRAAQRVATIGASFSYNFVVDDGKLYWVDDDSQIVSCAIEHCVDTAPTPLIATHTFKSGLRVADQRLYWLETPIAHETTLVSCLIDTCGQQTPIPVMGSHVVFSYALDSGHVYWIDEPDPQLAHSADDSVFHTVYRVPKPAL